MCSTTIEAAYKARRVNNGRQTKGSTNHVFSLASLLQVTKSAAGIAKRSVGTGMTKSASGDEIKCLTEIKETISTEMTVVTTAQSRVVAMTDLSINLYPIQKKRAMFLSLSLPSFLFPSSLSSIESPNESLSHIRAIEKRKAEIAFVGIEMSVLVFLFGVPAIAKLDKILKY